MLPIVVSRPPPTLRIPVWRHRNALFRCRPDHCLVASRRPRAASRSPPRAATDPARRRSRTFFDGRTRHLAGGHSRSARASADGSLVAALRVRDCRGGHSPTLRLAVLRRGRREEAPFDTRRRCVPHFRSASGWKPDREVVSSRSPHTAEPATSTSSPTRPKPRCGSPTGAHLSSVLVIEGTSHRSRPRSDTEFSSSLADISRCGQMSRSSPWSLFHSASVHRPVSRCRWVNFREGLKGEITVAGLQVWDLHLRVSRISMPFFTAGPLTATPLKASGQLLFQAEPHLNGDADGDGFAVLQARLEPPLAESGHSSLVHAVFGVQ